MNDTALFDELEQLAARRIGLRIPGDARDRFAAMLRERAAHLGYSLEDYRVFLAGKQATEEWEEFARAFTTGETFFFRDHGQFDLLRFRLLPELIARHHHDKTLRLWSAGCASGEEVYSLAMLVDMLLPLPQHGGWDILILGTDIDSAAIDKARRGRYGQWSFRMIPPALQQRYFHLVGNEWILDERIRRMVTLRVSNLVGEPFPDSELRDMDLILCRNVFIYFDPAAVSAVAAKFAATLREGGYLMTAHTELIGYPVRELESRLLAEGLVYRRRVQVPVPTSTIHRLQVREPFPSTFLRAREGPTPPSQPSPAGGGRSNGAGGERSQSPSLARSAGEGWVTNDLAVVGGQPSQMASSSIRGGSFPPAPHPVAHNDELLLKEAYALADKGEFDLAEQMCRKALAVNPLAAAPYFLLAQLAQIKGDFNQAKECLNKAIYLDPRFVAAYLELASLYERAEDIPRAQTLRRVALDIVRIMPNDAIIEQYETTAGELMQWLVHWERGPT